MIDERNSLKIFTEYPLDIVIKSAKFARDWSQIVRVLSNSKQHVKTCNINGKFPYFNLGSIWPQSSKMTKRSRI